MKLCEISNENKIQEIGEFRGLLLTVAIGDLSIKWNLCGRKNAKKIVAKIPHENKIQNMGNELENKILKRAASSGF